MKRPGLPSCSRVTGVREGERPRELEEVVTTKPKGIFITGTDTGVGKTFVAAGLLKAFRQAGRDAVPMKPVQTGCARVGRRWVAPDLEACLAAAGLEPSATERTRMAPYRFRPACSPHLAASRARVRISLPRLVAAFRSLSRDHELVVAEGAGGQGKAWNVSRLTPFSSMSTHLPRKRSGMAARVERVAVNIIRARRVVPWRRSISCPRRRIGYSQPDSACMISGKLSGDRSPPFQGPRINGRPKRCSEVAARGDTGVG